MYGGVWGGVGEQDSCPETVAGGGKEYGEMNMSFRVRNIWAQIPTEAFFILRPHLGSGFLKTSSTLPGIVNEALESLSPMAV
jgi:hypothetical protein